MKSTKEQPLKIPNSTMHTWQEIVDIMADLLEVPAGLIMRLNNDDIEVFASSQSEGNPYQPGDKEKVYGSGLYCETVIKTKDKLLIPNALADDVWKNNPDIKLNMISYLGFPILLPNGEPFGTICVLDSKENSYASKVEKLILKFRDLVQADLGILYMNHILGEKNKNLTDYLDELQTLRGLIRICSSCKKIKNANQEWVPIEKYLIQHPHADFSHSFCPKCAEEYESYIE
jgi:hypothetical protein